ncbi:MAG: nicotinate phosphoribosyltransferase [Salinigranum sp.]
MSDAEFGFVTPETLPLFTDLYELTMMQGYHERGHNPRATFSLFFRRLPADRGYVVAAGLAQALEFVERLSFGDRAVAYLADQGFGEGFLDHLAALEFTGDIRALPEGTPVFPDEPILEVTAPLIQAQLLETLLLNQVSFQTLVATKAARMRDVASRDGGDRTLVDFGSRRAHGTDAGVKAARAAFVGGFDGTSNVAAGELFDLPVFGTMAHSWVQSFETERAAFEAFLDTYGDGATLLVDTYDTLRGAELAVEVAEERGLDLGGVRLDSGDLAALSGEVREIVGADVDVFVSSGVDEYAIEEFLSAGGDADGFGPGTALVTSDDAPTLDAVYKLVAVEREGRLEPTMKLSTGKVTYPGPKSLHRVERDGRFVRDALDLAGVDGPGEEQLVTVVSDGTRTYDPPPLGETRERARAAVEKLPEGCRRLRDPDPYEVAVGDALREETEALREALAADRT